MLVLRRSIIFGPDSVEHSDSGGRLPVSHGSVGGMNVERTAREWGRLALPGTG